MTTLNIPSISLDNAKNLVTSKESGDNQDAQELLESSAAQTSIELFAKVGQLTRQLHHLLNDFNLTPARC
jgi:chemotaxis protein CheZ